MMDEEEAEGDEEEDTKELVMGVAVVVSLCNPSACR